MRNKFIKGYLYFLPIYSLLGIMLSVLRTAYQDSYASVFLLVNAVADTFIILLGARFIFKRQITIVVLLLFMSLIVGLLNNEISRRFITDLSNPFFFFSKVFIFSEYWKTGRFPAFSKYYGRVSFIGSLFFLPIVYYLFNLKGATRLAIFPPMELAFSNFVVNSNMSMLLVSFFVILLYGKRAQLVSALLVFFTYIIYFNRKNLPKYILILIVGLVGINIIFTNFSDNLAVQRFSTSFDLLSSENSDDESINRLSAGRFNEANIILEEMMFEDYFFGKGLGYTYVKDLGTELKEVTNAHFSPLGFVSKYGIFFTLFIYYFILSLIFKNKKHLFKDKHYLLALGVSLFIFFESFFAYAIFVTPILPIVLGYLLYKQQAINYNTL